MVTKLAEHLKETFSRMPAEMYEPLTFGELKKGDKFISIPVPGDNHAHGGFREEHHMFIKVEAVVGSRNINKNAVRLQDGTFSMMPDEMLVVKIS